MQKQENATEQNIKDSDRRQSAFKNVGILIFLISSELFRTQSYKTYITPSGDEYDYVKLLRL